MITIIHISPVFRTKGGISTVVTNYLGADGFKKYKLIAIDTHGEGTVMQKAFMALSAFAQSIKMALFNRPDIIHVHVGDFPSIYRKMIVTLPFLFRRNTKKVLHFHGAAFISQYKNQAPLLQKIIKYYFRQFDKVICLSETWQSDLTGKLGVSNSLVIHNAVKTPEKTAQLADKPRSLRILFLGLIGDRKGVFDLLESVKILIAEGHHVHLTIGGNGEIEKLKTLMQDPALKGSISYLGWINEEQRESAFLTSDVFALPSYAEGMPMSVLEAMSYGLPIISTNVGGIPELVGHDKNGILITPGDIKALVTALAQLSETPAIRKEMGKESRKIFEQSFSLDNHVKEIEAVYQSLLKDNI